MALTVDQRAALWALGDIPEDAAFVPTAASRTAFNELIELGLAVSRGAGLGGEGFAPTAEGRELYELIKPKLKGFAALSPERRREIARKGGLSVEPQERSFSKNRELASFAGRLGGEAGSGGTKRKKSGGATGADDDV